MESGNHSKNPFKIVFIAQKAVIPKCCFHGPCRSFMQSYKNILPKRYTDSWMKHDYRWRLHRARLHTVVKQRRYHKIQSWLPKYSSNYDRLMIVNECHLHISVKRIEGTSVDVESTTQTIYIHVYTCTKRRPTLDAIREKAIRTGHLQCTNKSDYSKPNPSA